MKRISRFCDRIARLGTSRRGMTRLAGTLSAVVLALCAATAVKGQEGFPFRPPPRDGAVIHGRVIDAEGEPVFGVAVFTSRMDAPANTPLTVGRAETGIDGYFSITGMTPGVFRLCVDAQGKAYLDPCEWSEEPLTVQLEENGVLRDLDIAVEAGEMLAIEVEDPSDALARFANQERLESEAKQKPSGALILGLRTRTGGMAPARLSAADKETRKLRYTVVAPKSEDLDVVLMPVNLELADQAAKKLADRGSIVRISKEQMAQKAKEEPAIAVTLARKGL